MKLSDHYTVIGVTGHTSGIGKAIHDRFIGSIGFSKSNGYGIKFESEAILDALEKENHSFKQQIKQLEQEAEEMLLYP